MDSTFAPDIIQNSALKSEVYASDIPFVLENYVNRIKVLSLDCFDTLLWRRVAAPKDVFYDMQHRAVFKTLGVTAYQRIAAAARAYRATFISKGIRQVSLCDIYQQFTALTEDQRNQLIEEELLAEMEACYAFPCFVELIRQAKALNIKVVVVSDMYLTEKQLRHLLSAHLPTDVMKSIDEIFCSVDFGMSKSEGLFQAVLDKLSLSAQTVLHVGDHKIADFEAPKKLGLHALHFMQFNTKTTDFLRIQHAASSLTFLSDPSIYYSRQARYSPFRGVFALTNPPLEKPESLIGYMTFGPVLYAFGRFIYDEIETLRQLGKRPKVFFLLRDAYLLSRACEAYAGKSMGGLARIRKFIAVAASFRTQADVDHYMSSIAPQHYNFWIICEQLLLPKELSMSIIQASLASSNSANIFNQLIHEESILNIIFEKSLAAYQRLKKYIQKEMELEPGDTLVLVDTGYMGVTQEFLMRRLQDDLNIEIEGRYLIASEEPGRPPCKALLTSSWCEHGLFEQSCTFKEGSVLDYDNEGNPILDTLKLSDDQYAKVKAIQEESLRFIHDAKQFFAMATISLPYSLLQKTAAAALKRQIFLPTVEEICYFEVFQHDKDMGATLTKTMFNMHHAVDAFRYSHPPYQAHPYETRAVSLDATLSSLMRRACDLDLPAESKSFYLETLKIIIMRDNEKLQIAVNAIPTHDGYFSCCVTLSQSHYMGIVFGEHYQWVQVDKIIVLNNPEMNIIENAERVVFHQMNKHNTLYECESHSSLIMISPVSQFDQAITYQIIFRPVVLCS
jgi:FMN phosphatase YigB (HAD superfamily)